MTLYDIVLDGARAPLTSEQISELFHAGRLMRHDPCKLAQNPTWRTIDEVFPLLKYGSPASGSAIAPSAPLVPHRNAFVLAAAITAAVCVAIIYLLARESSPAVSSVLPVTTPADVNRVGVRSPVVSTPNSAATVQPTIAQQPQALSSVQLIEPNHVRPSAGSGGFAAQQTSPVHLSATDAQVANYNAAMEMKQKGEQAAAEKAAAAQRWRADLEKRQADEKRLAGTSFVVPLGQYVDIDVGGVPTRVRIHDNNVLTFDAWVNGMIYKNVVKQKGISHTGEDETLIYNNGRASLYYVWELSGTLNHCLLRVREQ